MTGSENSISDEIQISDESSEESGNIIDGDNAPKKEKIVKEELSNKQVPETAAEENKPAEEKSESTASEADKTKDESKS